MENLHPQGNPPPQTKTRAPALHTVPEKLKMVGSPKRQISNKELSDLFQKIVIDTQMAKEVIDTLS